MLPKINACLKTFYGNGKIAQRRSITSSEMKVTGRRWPRTTKFATIQGRMGLLFLAFFLLVSVSAGLTFWGIETQKTDALVINLAGRQRMLIQQMTRLAG